MPLTFVPEPLWSWRAWWLKAKTEVGYLYHIDRGYDNFVLKLQRLGADIVRVNIEEEEN